MLESTVVWRCINRHIVCVNKLRTIILLYLALSKAQLSIMALLVWAADFKKHVGEKERIHKKKNFTKIKTSLEKQMHEG